MTTIFGTEFKPPMVDDKNRRQGRSRKTLKPVIKHDGRVWVARYEGRPSRFFGSSLQEAHNNLQAGAQ